MTTQYDEDLGLYDRDLCRLRACMTFHMSPDGFRWVGETNELPVKSCDFFLMVKSSGWCTRGKSYIFLRIVDGNENIQKNDLTCYKLLKIVQ